VRDFHDINNVEVRLAINYPQALHDMKKISILLTQASPRLEIFCVIHVTLWLWTRPLCQWFSIQ